MPAALARRPFQGTLYDARGNLLRVPTHVARAQALLSNALPGGYIGARTDRRALADWTPMPASPDADSIGDLPTLRARSRDLARNAPLAGGAINTLVTNAVGDGLRPQPRVDVDYLAQVYGVTEADADSFERQAVRLWRYHSDGQFFDVAGIDTHEALQAKALRAVIESGDVFALRRFKPRRPNALFGYCAQLVEADLCSNPDAEIEREGFAGGIESDADGTPIAYHFASRYPFDLATFAPITWKRVRVFGAQSGERQVRHLAWRRRIRQSRGVPYLALVIEPLKQLDRYGEAELMAAVIASMFTVFLRQTAGDLFPELSTEENARLAPQTVGQNLPVPRKLRLGSGLFIELKEGEEVQFAEPKRPNDAYDTFVQAKLREIGVALEIPFELLIKHFTASYSAARASRLEFWKFVTPVRGFVAQGFCQPDYEALVTEAVALGYLDAPGFFEDPLARQAWCGCWWVGPAPGQIDEESEINAAEKRINIGLSTREAETAALTGGSWERNHRQLQKEQQMRREAGLDVEPVAERIRTEPVEPESPDDRADGGDEDEREGMAPDDADEDREDRDAPQGRSRRRTRADRLDARDRREQRRGRVRDAT
jgi:lambda family phage portal protein